jgi:putative hydrolase of the HAD superfamily
VRALILDLDDTLYPERRFLLSGFAAVAAEVERMTGLGARTVFTDLVRSWRAGRRGHAFQDLCDRRGIGPDVVPRLVAAYREHAPRLRVPRTTRQVLEALRPRFRVAVLTNGLPAVQRRKVVALDLERFVDQVVYANEHGDGRGKPDPVVFIHAVSSLGVSADEAVMVGDDPECDIAGAREAGLRTIRVRTGRHRLVPPVPGFEADVTVESLARVADEASRLLQEGA